MKIFYDHQVFTYQNYGGISRYFFELITHAASFGFDYQLPLLASNNIFAKELDNEVFPFFRSVNFKGKIKVLDYINRFNTIKELKKQQHDLFHPTFYNDYFLKSDSNKKPLVVTCHDMIHEKFKELFVNDPTADRKKKQIEAATAVIAVSQNTKRDIIEILNVPQEKIFVTPLASSIKPELITPDNDRIERLGEYLLFVGVRHLYKNFLSYTEAIAPILRNSSLKLVCAGGGAFTADEKMFLQKLKLEHKVLQIPINDILLAQLYKGALAFVFPSKYEGFGIPAVEAFSAGTPVLLADTGSLPEVGGDVAAYFNPYDQQSMYKMTNRLINDEAWRANLKEKGLARAKEYSWEKTARLTFDIYRTVLQ